MTDEELDRLVGPRYGYLFRVLERLGQATPKQLEAESGMNYRTILMAMQILAARGLIEIGKEPITGKRRPAQLLRPKRPAA